MELESHLKQRLRCFYSNQNKRESREELLAYLHDPNHDCRREIQALLQTSKRKARNSLVDAWMAAVGKGYDDIVGALLTGGMDVNVRNECDRTALMLSCRNGHESTVRLLLEYHAEVNFANSEGQTALICSSTFGCESILQLLLEHNADVNAKNKDNKTALSSACLFGRESIVKLLLNFGADVNLSAALIYASEHGRENLIELLLDNGADIELKNSDGKTAYDVATSDKIKRILAHHTPISSYVLK